MYKETSKGPTFFPADLKKKWMHMYIIYIYIYILAFLYNNTFEYLYVSKFIELQLRRRKKRYIEQVCSTMQIILCLLVIFWRANTKSFVYSILFFTTYCHLQHIVGALAIIYIDMCLLISGPSCSIICPLAIIHIDTKNKLLLSISYIRYKICVCVYI